MMTQVLTGMNMPIRTDISSLAERLTNIETRLDDQDAKLDDILNAIKKVYVSKPQADTSAKAKGDR
jgi:hypothetical protein